MTQPSLWASYKLRVRRKRLLLRAWRGRRQIVPAVRRTQTIKTDDILLFACMRNEEMRLPHFLEHYRALGVGHFLIVDNGSTDATPDILSGQADVSLWRAQSSYKAARFGMDWLTALMWRYGHQHWCVTVDADELLIYPDYENRPLPHLTHWMTANGQAQLGSLMLDLYPKGPLNQCTYTPGNPPTDTIPWFDAYGYWVQRQKKMGNLWCQGGPRARVFFSEKPEQAPTLNKIPLVFWHRSYAYVNSTHNALPAWLNQTWDSEGKEPVSGVLLHTKFLPDAAERAKEERTRGEHFGDPSRYAVYYDQVTQNPNFWTEESIKFNGWRQLVDLRLMSAGKWLQE